MVRKIVQPRTFPLITCWTKDIIQKRLKIERTFGFGNGKLLDRIKLQETPEVKTPEVETPKVEAPKSEKPMTPKVNFCNSYV